MKKILIIALLAVCFLAPMGFTQEDVSASPEEKDKVLSTLEAAKNGQIEIEKTPEQLAREKEEIQIKKTKLIGDKPQAAADDPEIKKQLKVLEKQEQLIEAKELAIQERIEATEQAIAVIEQKIKIINSETLTLNDIVRESRKIRKSLRADKKEKTALKAEIPLIEMEINAIEKEIIAQKILLDLKGGSENLIKDSIEANEIRLEAARTEVDLINERVSFIDVQIETAKNYLAVLMEKRIDILKNKLLVLKPYSYEPFDAALILILLVCLFLISVVKRKISSGEFDKDHIPHHPRIMVRTLKRVLLFGAVYASLYFVISFSGYHELAIYLTYRIGLIAALTFVFVSAYHFLKVLFDRIISAEEEGSKERIMIKTTLDILSTVLAWGFFALGVFLLVEILGMRYEVMGMVVESAQKPFFTLGEVKLSVWLILKAIIILWVFIGGANILDAFLRKNVYRRMHLEESVQYTFSVTLKYLMLILGVLIGLSALGVELAALTVFAGTVGIGIGFGLQDIAKNFISGIVMLVERPVKVGDYIEVSGLPGKVKAIKARSTIVDTFDNISVIVPNAEFMNQQVVNWSYSDKITRVKISVGVAYGSNTELVKESLIEVAKTHGKVLHNPEPYVWFEEFGDSSLNFRLFVWTNEPQNRFGLKSDLHYMIDKIFRERGITIAFPQRDIHFKTSNVPIK